LPRYFDAFRPAATRAPIPGRLDSAPRGEEVWPHGGCSKGQSVGEANDKPGRAHAVDCWKCRAGRRELPSPALLSGGTFDPRVVNARESWMAEDG
jgi:hypothetical protein